MANSRERQEESQTCGAACYRTLADRPASRERALRLPVDEFRDAFLEQLAGFLSYRPCLLALSCSNLALACEDVFVLLCRAHSFALQPTLPPERLPARNSDGALSFQLSEHLSSANTLVLERTGGPASQVPLEGPLPRKPHWRERSARKRKKPITRNTYSTKRDLTEYYPCKHHFHGVAQQPQSLE